MSAPRCTALPLALILCLPLAAAAQAPSTQRYTRAVTVAAPGWTRLRLDPATLGKMAPDTADLRLYDAAGREVPYLLLTARAAGSPLKAEALSAQESAGGWSLEFDLGADAPPHRAFRFVFEKRTAAAGCRLEGSPDRGSWTELATGDLFRLGEGMGQAVTELAYAPTAARYLRLWWPRSAGYPELRDAAAEPAPLRPEEPIRAELAVAPDAAAPGVQAYRLALPGRGVLPRALDLRWRGPGVVYYRLLGADDGRWVLLSEGARAKPPSGPWPTIPLAPLEAGLDSLRLEVSAGTADAPVLETVAGEFEPRTLVFYAPAAERFTLGYGSLGLAPPDYPQPAPPAALDALPLADLGPEREGARPELPAARASAGSPMPSASFHAAWTVRAEGVRPGALVRCELPDGVYAQARPDLGDLRVECGGRQVPYLLHRPPEPALVLGRSGLVPSAGRERGRSEIVLDLPARNLPLSLLVLTAPASAFQRPVEVRFEGSDPRPGLEAPPAAPPSYETWSCAGASELPARLAIPLYAPYAPGGAERIRIRFTDGENPPLSDVGVALWRRRHVVLFFLPEGECRLLCSAPEVYAPRYDLEGLRGQLLAAPHAAASLETAAPAGRMGSRAVWWGLLAALVGAGAVLLAILARTLRRPAATEEEQAGGSH